VSSVCILIVRSLESGIVDYGLLPPPEKRKCHTRRVPKSVSKEDASAGILEYHYISRFGSGTVAIHERVHLYPSPNRSGSARMLEQLDFTGESDLGRPYAIAMNG